MKKPTIKNIVRTILLETENTDDAFLELVEECSIEIKEKVLKHLSQPFDLLLEEFIVPSIWFDGTYEFRYSDKDYREADCEVDDSSGILRKDEVGNKATHIWIERKRKEIETLLLERTNRVDLIVENNKIPTFTTSQKVKKEHLEALFKKLNELDLIRETDSTQFISCFFEKTLKEPPQIKFYQPPQILYYLFKLMRKNDFVINYDFSKIFDKNQLFVQKDGTKFKTPLRKGIDSLPNSPKDKSKEELVKRLEGFFERILSK